jgi:hypothetical protein
VIEGGERRSGAGGEVEITRTFCMLPRAERKRPASPYPPGAVGMSFFMSDSTTRVRVEKKYSANCFSLIASARLIPSKMARFFSRICFLR